MNKPMGVLAILAKGKAADKKEDDGDDEFTMAAREFAKAIKGGSEQDIADTLKSCIHIAYADYEKDEDDRGDDGQGMKHHTMM